MILKQNGKYHGTKKAYQYVEVQRARRLSYMQHAIMHSASSQRAPKKSNCVIHLVVFVHTVRTRLRCSIVSSSIKTRVRAWDKICGFCPPPLFLLALFRVCTLTKRLLESSKKRSRPRRSTSIDPEKMLRSSRGGGKGILAFFVCLRLFFGRHGLFFDVIFFS